MNAKVFLALALSTPLFVSFAKAIVYTVRTDSGPVTYSLYVPPGTPVGGKIKPNPRVTPGWAEVIAVSWAAGSKEKDKSNSYPNSLITLGGAIPGGFYNASYTKPTSVKRINAPAPYYLVQMRGYIAGSAQTFYAAVLDDGHIVRPVRVSRHAYAPVDHSKQAASGSREKKKRKSASRVLGDRATSRAMGGAELKEGSNGSDPSN